VVLEERFLSYIWTTDVLFHPDTTWLVRDVAIYVVVWCTNPFTFPSTFYLFYHHSLSPLSLLTDTVIRPLTLLLYCHLCVEMELCPSILMSREEGQNTPGNFRKVDIYPIRSRSYILNWLNLNQLTMNNFNIKIARRTSPLFSVIFESTKTVMYRIPNCGKMRR
jgi:hypothetical protein